MGVVEIRIESRNSTLKVNVKYRIKSHSLHLKFEFFSSAVDVLVVDCEFSIVIIVR